MDKQHKEDMEVFGFKNLYLLGDFSDYIDAYIPDPWFFKGFDRF